MKFILNIILLILLPVFIYGQDFWNYTNGPYGAHIRTLFADSTNNIWAGTFNGFFISTNQGQSWSKHGTYDIVPTNFVINHKGKMFVTSYWGIFKTSTDNGQSWQDVSFPGFFDIHYLYIDKSDRIFASSSDGLFRSTDDGETWLLISSTQGAALIEDSNERLYFSREWNDIYYSTDFGDTWNSPDSMITSAIDHPVSGFATNSNNEIFGGSIEGVLYSKDRGKTWRLSRIDSNYTYVYSISIDKNDRIFAGTNKGIFISLDNGGTWEKIDLGFNSFDGLATCVDNSGDIFFGLNHSVIVHSSDGGANWNFVNNGLKDVSLSSIDIDSNDNIAVGSEYGGVYYFNGITWEASLPTTQKVTSLRLKSDSTIYVGTESDGLFKSTDKGRTWRILNDSAAYKYVNSLFIDSNENLYIGTTHETFVSSNDGATWSRILTCGTLVFQQNSEGAIYAGTNRGIYKSDNNHTTWTLLNNDIPVYDITALAIYNDYMILAGNIFGGIYKSFDSGKTWIQIREEPGGDPVLMEPIEPIAINKDCVVYVAFPEEFRYSNDSAQTWFSMNTWVGRKIVFDRSGFMYTISDGVYVSKNSTTTSVQTENLYSPSNYYLSQNYPNPFNPGTQIKYSIPETGFISLKVFNLLGEEVAVMFEGVQQAGNHSSVFNGTGLTSGIYLYQLSAKNFLQTRKLLLIK